MFHYSNKDCDDYSVFLNNLELNISYYENYGKQISIMRIDMLNLKEENLQRNEEMKVLQKKIDDLKQSNIKMENENKQYKDELQKNMDDLNQKIDNLTKRVDFMESILFPIISRKAINHCICKIIDAHKDSISIKPIINENGETFYKIEFIKDVNNIKKQDINDMMDSLFVKKGSFNCNAHLIGIEMPQYIDDLWNKILKYIDLENKNLTVFNAIVTAEIKNEFSFDQEYISVKDFIKKKFKRPLHQNEDITFFYKL